VFRNSFAVKTTRIIIIMIIIIYIYLSWCWATCWPVPVLRIQKSLQRSAMIPFANWGIVFHYPSNPLRGILFTCCIQFLLHSSNLAKICVIYNSFAKRQGRKCNRLLLQGTASVEMILCINWCDYNIRQNILFPLELNCKLFSFLNSGLPV